MSATGMPLVQLVNKLPLAKILRSELICQIMVPIVPNGPVLKLNGTNETTLTGTMVNET
jgi:hypothetical protein